MRIKDKSHKNVNIGRIINNNWFLVKIALEEAPLYTITRLFELGRNRIIVFFEHVWLIGYIINAIQYEEPFQNVLTVIVTIFTVIVIWANLWTAFLSLKVYPKATENINKRIRMVLFEKAVNMDLKCYDDPKFYNDFVWAMSEAVTRVYSVIRSCSNFFGSIISILLVSGYIISQDKIGLFFVLLSFFGILFLNIRRSKINLDLNNRIKPFERQCDYIKRVLYLSDHAKEIRLNNVKDKLRRDFDNAVSELDREMRKGTRALAVLDFLVNFVFNDFIIDGLYLYYLLFLTIVKQSFGYGTMVTLYKSCNQVKNSLWNLSNSIPEFQEHSLYIEKIRVFLDYETEIVSNEGAISMPSDTADLELRNVSFSYGKKNVLKSMNLKIRAGEKIALVGYNGAGKTTLIKLLLRLYDATEGEVLYNNKSVKEYNVKEYRDLFEVVFQDYQLFAATVGQNITMDSAPLNEENAAAAIHRGGFANKLSSLQYGLDTQVTKEFDEDGVLFSGGEAQSLVISRALYKNSPIIILDEPSSALDPIAEYNLNNTMLNPDTDKTVIIISHRLSTTKMADRIYMLEDGQIIEQGTHEELMNMNGKYALMFNLQAEKYIAQ